MASSPFIKYLKFYKWLNNIEHYWAGPTIAMDCGVYQ